MRIGEKRRRLDSNMGLGEILGKTMGFGHRLSVVSNPPLGAEILAGDP
jgi:hypothetical protein